MVSARAFPGPARCPSLLHGRLTFRRLEETDMPPALAVGCLQRQGFSWTPVVGGSGPEARLDVLGLPQNALCSLISDSP